MGKISLGIYIEDQEYEKRFCAIVMSRYRASVRLHIYSEQKEIPQENQTHLDALLIETQSNPDLFIGERNCKVFCLQEAGNKNMSKKVITLEKYQNIAAVMDEIMREVGREICEIRESGQLQQTQFWAIYGVCESEFQLPFCLTLATILAERERVMVLDLQENSGLLELPQNDCLNLEDVLLLTKTRQMTLEKLEDATGHRGEVDYIYPARNTEIISEADYKIYQSVIDFIRENADYQVVLINFGSRFQGFFDLLNQCGRVYMMQKKGGLGRWREQEFTAELQRRGYQSIIDRISRVEIPLIAGNINDCETIVEQWRWNDFGDSIRKMSYREAVSG
ncbi:MAG: hypothetical protein K6G13_04775 [Agathobacter sp.]|uniref:hypothetical protein n=1 Tax=Agathobacter sp. TaxID=2021311 RepID=UPI00258A9B84|nr:hypothetical protein [Agathobacter sp.]MCR5677326.1 hypothetical protein [Agathobacter sp.]